MRLNRILYEVALQQLVKFSHGKFTSFTTKGKDYNGHAKHIHRMRRRIKHAAANCGYVLRELTQVF